MKKIILFFCFMFMGIFVPLNVFAVEDGTDLIMGAKSGILIEASTGKIIYEKNMNNKLAVASMTKMVAQIIIFDEIRRGNISYDDIITVSLNASEMGGSQIYLSEGEKISVRDLIKGISMASANDATVMMAEVIAGNESDFVKLMNKKVKDLGLSNTNFVNCVGFDEENHYSSAYDMAMIARELVINYPEVLEFSSVYEDYLRQDTDDKFWLVNTNKLVRYYDGADGLKTGHTDMAKYCLAATALRDDMRLIAVVLGEEESKTRNNEVMALLDYGYNNIEINLLKKRGEVIDNIKVDKSDIGNVDVVLQNDLGIILDKGSKLGDYKYKVDIKDIVLPLKKGDVVGTIEVYDKDKVIASSNLIINKDISKIGYFKLLVDNFVNLVGGII